jgi:hypothetical protein
MNEWPQLARGKNVANDRKWVKSKQGHLMAFITAPVGPAITADAAHPMRRNIYYCFRRCAEESPAPGDTCAPTKALRPTPSPISYVLIARLLDLGVTSYSDED